MRKQVGAEETSVMLRICLAKDTAAMKAVVLGDFWK